MITYLEGDATAPDTSNYDDNYIVHCVNNIGRWGAGFVVALSKRFTTDFVTPHGRYFTPEQVYHNLFDEALLSDLGDIQWVPVSEDLAVINLVGQDGVASSDNRHPIRYDAIRDGFAKIEAQFLYPSTSAALHLPRIGAGLAGGEWSKIEEIINDEIVSADVFVYDPPGNQFRP